MNLTRFVKQSANRIPAVKRIQTELQRLRQVRQAEPELHRLRAENAAQNSSIRLLAAEIEALRGRVKETPAGKSGVGPASGAGPVPPFSQKEVGRYFTVPLADLGSREPKHAGVLCPEPELGLPKVGVTDSLLGGAEDYFQKYENYGYIFNLLQNELQALGATPIGIAVDFGSGFGNTVIPLLENFRDVSIIATDISPDLLAILLREADKRRLRDRCVAVAFDAQRDYLRGGFADFVFGGAVLHHLAEPEALLKVAMKVLKPGGHAIFFEPFENGYAILRLAYEEILKRASETGETAIGVSFLRSLALDIAVRTHRRNYPGFSDQWFHLDDKWLFTHTYFDNVRRIIGASNLQIHPFNAPMRPFTIQTENALVNYGGLTVPNALPDWAWEILRRYDDVFSPDMRNDLILEGAVVITK